MKRYLVVPREAPPQPWPCELVEVDIPAIPFMLFALGHKAQRYYWTNDEEATKGRQLLAKQAAGLLMGCSKEIVEAVNQLYRLTDSVHNGTQYSVSGSGTPESPYVYSPAIPIVPSTQPGAAPSVKYSLERLERLQDNLTNGTAYSDAPDTRNIRQQLEDIKTALEASDDLDPEILQELVQIVALLA